MARKLRASSLSLKLDVIIEEDVNDLAGNLSLTDQISSSAQQPTINVNTCTITLRNSDRPSGNDPQFLHCGRWPSMDMVDALLDSTIEPIQVRPFERTSRPISPTVLRQNSITKTAQIDAGVATWGLVTAEELSMVMDYWDPDDEIFPSFEKANTTPKTASPSSSTFHLTRTVTNAQRKLFLREVIDEHLTRAQTLEHIEELEDNDSAVEIVATLEGYRQNGWAEEMIKAFPRECWLLWTSSGLDRSTYQICTDSI